ncbi:histidine phosphatase family protein [Companilactobacillus sp.]|jgi:probable phosphoglycerate mutase|uniref:histidine phosphatase family protein n=1 Tax=Companilactobacillus sp. TaxID=2767905 RepID=UPI0025BE6C1B|nr:histidine phosphatase family protein [Companilactobacillus sp.]MCH4009574.1 histidine phosphatase family protein [Companilactobacillus sp.]MCH4052750.1 histidine phosphatase family protein [Companilactobacillus sp.]MCH4077516.1 histidine phosphatase family protein [Companilactobacillus sp.]MCH4126092.1 histidine phosphatase family protein [Companilactobacillus sp.]MCI1311800.1 histidine phosphatase family protein [Companilactobacillus sp.]
MTKYQVYLVRHGKTWFNRYDKMQGWSDSPLAPDGVEVANQAAEALKDVDFAAAFSSDARRAIDTCKIIVDENKNHDKITPHKLPAFREEFYGYFEGNNSHETWFIVGQPHGAETFGELVTKVGMDKSKDYLKEADPFHDAENAEEYWNRVNKGFKQIDDIAKDGDKILLVSHGTTIRSITDRYNAGNFDITVSPRNSSLTIMEVDDGERKVTTYNKMLN